MHSVIVQFDKNKPMYQQIYDKLVRDIRTQVLLPNEKLPSKRSMSAQLGVSVNTVDTAYQMLVAEGYVTSKAKSGFTVCKMPLPIKNTQGESNFLKVSNNYAQEKSEEEKPEKYMFDFTTSNVDTSLFPFKIWHRLQRDVIAASSDLLNHGHRQGDFELRQQIANYLREFRGADCIPQQIVVGAGIEYLLSILARMFNGSVFAVENPGYAKVRRILQNSGAKAVPVQVNKSGMCVNSLYKSGANLAYVTPSHQFPTGATMPVAQRTDMLHWASTRRNTYIIEDDYDSEFRYDTKPLSCLQGLDSGENVIYIGTFSRCIAPAIRIGYMVLPQKLLQKYTQEFGFYSCTVSRFEQQTLCQFMRQGHFARHLARLRTAYKQRRDTLVSALSNNFGETINISGHHTGLHLVVSSGKIDEGGIEFERRFLQTAQQNNVMFNTLSSYYGNIGKEPCEYIRCGAVLGYGGIAEQNLKDAAKALYKSYCMV